MEAVVPDETSELTDETAPSRRSRFSRLRTVLFYVTLIVLLAISYVFSYCMLPLLERHYFGHVVYPFFAPLEALRNRSTFFWLATEKLYDDCGGEVPAAERTASDESIRRDIGIVNGSMISDAYYKGGEMIEYKVWRDNGVRHWHEFYVDGRTRARTWYNDEGVRITQTKLDEHGNGIVTSYTDSGEQYSTLTLKNNRRMDGVLLSLPSGLDDPPTRYRMEFEGGRLVNSTPYVEVEQ